MLRRFADQLIARGETKSKSQTRVAEDLHIMVSVRYHYEQHGCFGRVETSQLSRSEFSDYIDDTHAFLMREWHLESCLEVI